MLVANVLINVDFPPMFGPVKTIVHVDLSKLISLPTKEESLYARTGCLIFLALIWLIELFTNTGFESY